MRKVIVVGGGAAGLMAAVSAAQNGAEVMLLDHKDFQHLYSSTN